MDRQTQFRYNPASVPAPGETVLDYLESFEWSQRELALRTGLTPKTISEICSGKAPITPNTALAFEKVLKRPAHFWLNLQQLHDEFEARNRMAVTSTAWTDWAKRFPLSEMKRYRYFDDERYDGTTADVLLGFFGVSSPSSWQSVWQAKNVAYRQTSKFYKSPEAISAWVRATEISASRLESEIGVNEFDADRLRMLLRDLRSQTREPVENAIPAVRSICAKAGVLAVWVPELKNTGISGCARWLSEKKAVVAVTLRYKTDDQMWFTFFHELGHILLHRKESKFILDNAADNLNDEVVDVPMRAREEEANRFAANTLIPPEQLFEFILGQNFSNEAIHDFSEHQGVAPGIVVGRLQHEKVLDYHQGNNLKQRLSWNNEE
jgi:HTH-type transcriptional regulator / antitoxin HigA